MMEENSIIMISVGAPPADIEGIKRILEDSQPLVLGNYDGEDPYSVADYLKSALTDGLEFHAMFDRNIISPLAKLARGEAVPASIQGQQSYRLAAACLGFCVLSRITIEPNIAMYEYASNKDHAAAQEDTLLFRLIDNADPRSLIDIALGRTDAIPSWHISMLREQINTPKNEIAERDFTRRLRMWEREYLFALKAASFRRTTKTSFDAAIKFLEWQAQEACFSAPATLYCTAAISHAPPKGDMLKGILSKNFIKLGAGLRNATWDMCLLRQFGRYAKTTGGPLWSLWSADEALKSIAKVSFKRGEEDGERGIKEFFIKHWGPRDGGRLTLAYENAMTIQKADSAARDRQIKTFLQNVGEHIKALEQELGLSTSGATTWKPAQ